MTETPTSPSVDSTLHTPTPWRVKPGTAIIEQFKDGLPPARYRCREPHMTDNRLSPGNADARDFYNMSGPDLLAYCGEDASKWAEAFCKIKEAQGWSANDIDENLMITWFANAIEHSSHIRTAVPAQAALDSPATSDIRWAVNVLLEKIAVEFEAWDTMDLWRSDAASTVRSFKHDLASSSVPSTERLQLNKKTLCPACNLLSPCSEPGCPNAIPLTEREGA